MPNTRDIRRRIKSVKNTAQITKAMQMVAASKMQRAQQAALAGKPYADEMNRMLATMRHATIEKASHPFLETRENKTPCVLLITTDKGLCGGLNANLFKEVTPLPSNTHFISIGRRGRQFLARTKRNLVADFDMREHITPRDVRPIADYLSSSFLKEEIDSVSILYPDFINTLVQRPRLVQLLPITDFAHLHASTALDNHLTPTNPEGMREYLFEPDPLTILNQLLPYYIDFMLYQILLDARASEHSARMVAMKNATENAQEIIKDLTMEYNKVRQAGITNEILEIATAQMALN